MNVAHLSRNDLISISKRWRRKTPAGNKRPALNCLLCGELLTFLNAPSSSIYNLEKRSSHKEQILYEHSGGVEGEATTTQHISIHRVLNAAFSRG